MIRAKEIIQRSRPTFFFCRFFSPPSSVQALPHTPHKPYTATHHSTHFTMTEQWKAGLFDCFNDTSLCVNVWLCSHCVYGKINEVAHQESCFLCCCIGGILHPCQREKFVKKYQIAEPCINSWIIACFCGSCSICQIDCARSRGP